MAYDVITQPHIVKMNISVSHDLPTVFLLSLGPLLVIFCKLKCYQQKCPNGVLYCKFNKIICIWINYIIKPVLKLKRLKLYYIIFWWFLDAYIIQKSSNNQKMQNIGTLLLVTVQYLNPLITLFTKGQLGWLSSLCSNWLTLIGVIIWKMCE